MSKSIAIVLGAALLLGACAMSSTRPYTPSMDNVIQIKSKMAEGGHKASINTDVAAEGVKLNQKCRLVGPLDVGAGKSIPDHIAEAMRAEFFMADAYDLKEGMPVSAEITTLKFDSFGAAKWIMGLDVFSENGTRYSVEIRHDYKSSWDAFLACKNAADAFAPAVQELIKQVVVHPEFDALMSD